MVSYQLSANLVENMEDTELVNESQITNKTQTTMTASEMSAGGTAQESAIPIVSFVLLQNLIFIVIILYIVI